MCLEDCVGETLSVAQDGRSDASPAPTNLGAIRELPLRNLVGTSPATTYDTILGTALPCPYNFIGAIRESSLPF